MAGDANHTPTLNFAEFFGHSGANCTTDTRNKSNRLPVRLLLAIGLHYS